MHKNRDMQRLARRSRFFRPFLVWAAGRRLFWTKMFGADVSEDEVLRRNRAACKTAQESELAGVSHCVGEWSLEKNLWGYPMKFGADLYVVGDVGQDLVEVGDGGGEIQQYGRAVSAADEEGAGVPEHAVHVADQLVRGANEGCGTEVREFGRGIAQRFLCSVGERGEEVS